MNCRCNKIVINNGIRNDISITIVHLFTRTTSYLKSVGAARHVGFDIEIVERQRDRHPLFDVDDEPAVGVGLVVIGVVGRGELTDISLESVPTFCRNYNNENESK